MLKRLMLGMLLPLVSMPVFGHGGVSIENDVCVMRIGPMRAHFTGYQPELRATQEFCEDIPEVAHSIIVLDVIDKALRSMPIEFYLLRDSQNLGKAARFGDLGGMDSVRSEALFSMPPKTYPRGTVKLEYDFTEPGWYIGVLQATDPDSGQPYQAVFPFRVGVVYWWKFALPMVLIVIVTVLAYRISSRKAEKKANAAA